MLPSVWHPFQFPLLLPRTLSLHWALTYFRIISLLQGHLIGSHNSICTLNFSLLWKVAYSRVPEIKMGHLWGAIIFSTSADVSSLGRFSQHQGECWGIQFPLLMTRSRVSPHPLPHGSFWPLPLTHSGYWLK